MLPFSIPADYATRAVLGVEVIDAMVHLRRDAGTFCEYWDRTGSGNFAYAPEQQLHIWETTDRGRACNVDPSNLRFEQRSPIPWAVGEQLGEDIPGIAPTRRLGMLAQSLSEDIRVHLAPVMAALSVSRVRRVGVAVDYDLPVELGLRIFGPWLAESMGGTELTALQIVASVRMGARADAPRIIVTVRAPEAVGGRVSRFVPAKPDVVVVSLDYQERFPEGIAPINRGAKRAGGLDLVAECGRIVQHAVSLFHVA